jgi:hypothetical protein
MAIGVVFDGVGVSQDQYCQVFNQVTDHGKRTPAGLLSHHAGPTEDGLCVIATWEAEDALQRFFEDALGHALAAANISTQPTRFAIVNVV